LALNKFCRWMTEIQLLELVGSRTKYRVYLKRKKELLPRLKLNVVTLGLCTIFKKMIVRFILMIKLVRFLRKDYEASTDLGIVVLFLCNCSYEYFLTSFNRIIFINYHILSLIWALSFLFYPSFKMLLSNKCIMSIKT